MSDKKKKRKKKSEEEFLPDCVLDEAQAFLKRISEDVEIYRKIRMLESLPANDEADSFSLWWNFERYLNCPSCLGVLYDNYDDIVDQLGDITLMNGFELLQKKMILCYRLMRKYNYIGERI